MTDVSRDRSYWNEYYKKAAAPSGASSFAEFCAENYLTPEGFPCIAEFGCGNGRDSFYFAGLGYKLSCVDISEVGIETNAARAEKDGIPKDALEFRVGNFAEELPSIAEQRGLLDGIYSRFTMHAVPYDVQLEIVARAYEYLREGGMFLVECRTLNDPLMQQGEQLSSSERITDHYRRFIDSSNFISQLMAVGFEPMYFIEKNGLAVYKDDDPVVGRFIFRKPRAA